MQCRTSNSTFGGCFASLLAIIRWYFLVTLTTPFPTTCSFHLSYLLPRRYFSGYSHCAVHFSSQKHDADIHSRYLIGTLKLCCWTPQCGCLACKCNYFELLVKHMAKSPSGIARLCTHTRVEVNLASLCLVVFTSIPAVHKVSGSGAVLQRVNKPRRICIYFATQWRRS